ncbi:ABC transporter permease [Arthrobacter sp. 2MCAF15]|uniref:ABC transporter permease n=1 Tax=Arthrobacter sp. 2MCAF15 TaxID=3232984 RepID=UPI003F8E6BE1
MEKTRIPLWQWVWVACVAAVLLAPVFVVVPLSFTDRDSFVFPPKGWSLDYYREFFSSPIWRQALFNSLQVAVLVTFVSTVLGTAAAFALTRGTLRGAAVINALLLSPMVLPAIVVAIALFGVFSQWHLVGTFGGFVIAHTLLALPFVIVTVSASLRTFDRIIERAAASLGANRTVTLARVTLPLILPGILSGAVFAFVTSFDEVTIALFIQSPNLRTLPSLMYTSVTAEVDPTIAAASTVIIVFTTAIITLPQLIRKSSNV